jgi:hypothetical protein
VAIASVVDNGRKFTSSIRTINHYLGKNVTTGVVETGREKCSIGVNDAGRLFTAGAIGTSCAPSVVNISANFFQNSKWIFQGPRRI